MATSRPCCAGSFRCWVPGCGTPAPVPPPDTGTGSPAASPSVRSSSPTPTAPARSVTAGNLLTVDDVPNDDPVTWTTVESPPKAGRRVTQSYLCLPPDGLTALEGTAMVTRNFGYRLEKPEGDPYPGSPLKNQPVIYTQALQFPDEAAATRTLEASTPHSRAGIGAGETSTGGTRPSVLRVPVRWKVIPRYGRRRTGHAWGR